MEITKREIIASITIVAIMLLIGAIISGKISELLMDTHEKYNKATKIENSDLFKYGMDTNIGNAFVYGELNAIDPVTYPEINGEYLSIKKVKERYTQHTRTVTTTVNGKRTTKVETYWTWDRVGSEEIKASIINFCGIEFKYSQFNRLNNDYICTIKESSNVRYKYYGHPAKSKGTIFAYLANGNLGNDGANYYKGMTILETVDYLDSNLGLIIYWLLWIMLTIGITYGFLRLENKWLMN